MIDSASIVGSKIVRAVLGSADDRKPGPIERHIESMVAVLRAVPRRRRRMQESRSLSRTTPGTCRRVS